MTLSALLNSYDDAALTAVTSKGLLIRAGKDVANGKVSLTTQDADSATLTVLDETVALYAKSLEAARCPCPATGVCRHIIAAVLYMRDQTDAPTQEPAAPLDFALKDIEKFAAADWAFACALAEQADVPDNQGSVVVTFTESDAQVTFPQGMGLRDAIYKGTVAAHKRRCIAAAALAVAQSNGTELPEVIAASTAPKADEQTLDRIAEALEMAAVSLSAGTFAQVQGHLFNLAISTRAEAIPRIAAELRGLSQRMTPEALRQATITPIDVLGGIARTYALVDALRVAPDDPALVGILARSFVPSGPKSLAYLGGETWETPSGAKGLTLVFSDLKTGEIHRATHARGAGTDLNYNPANHWRTPLWSLTLPGDMKGRTVDLEDAAMAGDNGLGLSQKATFGPDIGLSDIPAVHTIWAKALDNAATQVGRGLRRRPGDAFVVIAPQRVDALSFDAYAQVPIWDWTDENGDTLTLHLPSKGGIEQALNALTRRIKAGLVAIPQGNGAPRLVSIWLDGPSPGPLSLGLDPLPKPKGLGAMMDRFMERAAPRAVSEITPLDPLALYFERACEALVTGISGSSGLPSALAADAQALGLGQIISANDRWTQNKNISSALRLAYLLTVGRDMARGNT